LQAYIRYRTETAASQFTWALHKGVISSKARSMPLFAER